MIGNDGGLTEIWILLLGSPDPISPERSHRCLSSLQVLETVLNGVEVAPIILLNNKELPKIHLPTPLHTPDLESPEPSCVTLSSLQALESALNDVNINSIII